MRDTCILFDPIFILSTGSLSSFYDLKCCVPILCSALDFSIAFRQWGSSNLCIHSICGLGAKVWDIIASNKCSSTSGNVLWHADRKATASLLDGGFDIYMVKTC